MRIKSTLLSLAIAASLGTGPILAQEADDGPILEEVMVTATKRVTTEMETAISIQTITGDDLVKNNLVNLDDISNFVPNVDIANGLTHASISIRGIGSGQERSFEQSVAMFIDEVYMPRSRQYRAPFFDMERVEILRGPQAVLFGLNATAGTVNVTSASSRPGDDPFLKVTGGYEFEYNGYTADVVAGGGVGETLGLRLAARYRDTGDGFYYNQFTGQDENSLEEKIIRGTMVWAPTQNLNITGKINWAEGKELGEFGEPFGATAAAVTGDGDLDWVRSTDPSLSTIVTATPPGFDHETAYGLLDIEYALGDYILTGIASYSKDDYFFVVSTAELPAPSFSNVLAEDFEQTSFEIRLESPAGRFFEYLAGIYYSDNTLETSLNTVLGPLFLQTLAANSAYLADTDTETLSAFASLTFNINDDMKIIAGGRYSDQDKHLDRDRLDCFIHAWDGDTNPLVQTVPDELINIAGLGGLCGESGDRIDDFSSSNFMPEIAFQWFYSDASMAYAKWGESVKAGGMTFSNIPNPIYGRYDDEMASGFEIGLKSRFMGGRAEFNIALFHTTFEDMQLNSFVPNEETGIPDAVVRNAGEATNKGVEVEFNIAATDWLTLGTSVGYLDSSFDNFDNGPCYPGEDQDGTLPGTCDKSGLDTPNSPRWSGNAYADMAFPITGNLLLTGGINMGFSDDYFTDGSIDPGALQDSYTRWDARIGLAQIEGNWSIALIGKNLSDEAVNSFTQPLVGYLGYITPPRTITLQGTYIF